MGTSDDHQPVFIVSGTECEAAHEDVRGCSYQVAWQINPHMTPGSVDRVRACAQHRLFVTELRRAGATVLQAPFVHEAFDSVFAKDNALLRDDGAPKALLSRFADERRQKEQRARHEWLERNGFAVQAAEGAKLEGGDVVRLADGTPVLGVGFRSDARALSSVESFFEREGLLLALVDPWLYHLDTAMFALPDGTVFLCRDAFSEASLYSLGRHPAVSELVFIPRDEALRFALNVVPLGETIITGTDAPFTTARLLARGYRVRPVKLSQFHLAGGSAACLSSRVYVEERVATSETTQMRSTSA